MHKLAVVFALLGGALDAQNIKPVPLVGSLTTFSTQIIPLVTIGDGWSQRFVVQNTDDTFPSTLTIKFFTKDGTPMLVSIIGAGPAPSASAFTFNLQAGKSVAFDTVVSNAPLQIGWAYLGSSAGSGNFFGQTIFRKSTPGLPDFMCSMVFGGLGFQQLSTFFDNTSGNITAMGIVTSIQCGVLSCADTVPLVVTVRDISGAVVSQKIVNQKLGTLNWINLGNDYPETIGKLGTFEAKVLNAYSTTLTGVSLEWSGNGAFTIVTPFEK